MPSPTWVTMPTSALSTGTSKSLMRLRIRALISSDRIPTLPPSAHATWGVGKGGPVHLFFQQCFEFAKLGPPAVEVVFLLGQLEGALRVAAGDFTLRHSTPPPPGR